VVVFDLSVLERELPSRSLAREVTAVGVFVSSSIRTGVWHLVVEITVVMRYVAPTGGLHRTEEMRGLTMGGDVVEPRAVRTAAAFLVLVLGQGVILCVLAVPGNSTACPSLQA
jgi:hypothetical protein